MLARLSRGVAARALRSPRLLGSALPVLGVSRAREQHSLLHLAGAGALLSALLASDEAECMGKRGPQAKAKAPPPPPKAKGKGPIKRTPTSAFDPAAKDDDVYQCEKIVGRVVPVAIRAESKKSPFQGLLAAEDRRGQRRGPWMPGLVCVALWARCAVGRTRDAVLPSLLCSASPPRGGPAARWLTAGRWALGFQRDRGY